MARGTGRTVALVCAALALVAGPAGAVPGVVGADNVGYAVGEYLIDATHDPATGHVEGRIALVATAARDLPSLAVVLRAPAVSRVEVDGWPAGFTRTGDVFVVAPRTAPRAGARFVVTVRFDGVPPPVDGFRLTGRGWRTAGRATVVITVTVPAGAAAGSNGRPLGRATTNGFTTYVWGGSTARTPVAVVAVGRVEAGDPVLVAVDGVVASVPSVPPSAR